MPGGGFPVPQLDRQPISAASMTCCENFTCAHTNYYVSQSVVNVVLIAY